MKITIWSDFACPFCYLGETMLEKALNDLGLSQGDNVCDNEVALEFKSYELNPDAPVVPSQTMTEHFMSAHDITEAEAVSQMERIAKMASRVGLDYNLAGVKVCSTFDAHRLMKYAAEHVDAEKVLRLNFALFKANFIDNLQLSDRRVLADIAEREGLDRTEVELALGTDRYADEVRKEEREADSHNLEYIPYMLFDNGAVLQGVLSPGGLKKAITSAIETGKADTCGGHPCACGTDGCALPDDDGDGPQQLGLDSCAG